MSNQVDKPPRAREQTSVLVVDDTDTWRSLAVAVLERHGYTVAGTASDGVEAVECIHETRPDVVLMDIDMPKLNGMDATRLISRLYPTVRVVAVSSHTESTYASRMFDAGAAAYVRKDQFLEKLTSAIDAMGEPPG